MINQRQILTIKNTRELSTLFFFSIAITEFIKCSTFERSGVNGKRTDTQIRFN